MSAQVNGEFGPAGNLLVLFKERSAARCYGGATTSEGYLSPESISVAASISVAV